MRLASDVDKVVSVNVSVPRPWESAMNATLVGWNTGSETAAGLFRSDGYHLTTEGIDACVGMIMAEAMD